MSACSPRSLRVTTVVGARPQFVKAAVVSRALEAAGIGETLVHTGQHYDNGLSGQFFFELGMRHPDHELHVGSRPHGEQTGLMLAAIEQLLLANRPDWVLVYGDTNSTLAGTLAAAKLHIPVAHVEAGLRSWNRQMPEEINRVLTDHAASLLLTPTESATMNLQAEGISGASVVEVGDVMYDAALRHQQAADPAALLSRLGVRAGEYVLATVHRAENTDDPGRLDAIFQGLRLVARELPVVVPLHPRTRKALLDLGSDAKATGQLRLVAPLGYLEMLAAERAATLIATDSGGVQKEAYFFRVPCVTLREETEWTELVEHGWNRLCPPSSAHTVKDAIRGAIGHRGAEIQLYGEGRAAPRVARALQEAAA